MVANRITCDDASEPRPATPQATRKAALKRHLWGEDSYYRISFTNWKWTFLWAATGNLLHAWHCNRSDHHAHWPITACWNTPWASTDGLLWGVGGMGAGFGLAGLANPGQSHAAQDRAREGFGLAEVADRRWLCQLETHHLGVNHGRPWDTRQQPVGPGRPGRAPALSPAAEARNTRHTSQLCQVHSHAQVC